MTTADVLTAAVAAPPVSANPSDPYEREAQTFPRLTEEQVARAKAFGCVQDLPEGTVLFERGQHTVDFFLVLQGNVEIYDTGPDGRPTSSRSTPRTSSPASSTCSATGTSWSAGAWAPTGASRA